MTRAEKEDLRAVLDLLSGVVGRLDEVAADVSVIRQAILSHRDRIARLEARLEDGVPVDPAA